MGGTLTKTEISMFIQNLREEEKSKATIEKYSRDVYKLYEWLGEDKMLTKERMVQYKEHLVKIYKPTSVNSILAGINSFLEFSDLTGLKAKRLKIQRKIFCDKDAELTKEEYYRLIETAELKKHHRTALMIQTLCATGIRVSELKYIDVHAITNGRAEINCKGKIRVILIPNMLAEKLKGYCDENKIGTGMIFVTSSGKPLDRSNIWTEMKNLCKEAQVNPCKVYPHNLRHLFARTYYGIEKDLNRLSDILGHSSIETTRVYTITTSDEQGDKINQLGLVK
ncbi:MAG: tyrosine-type recombinase/integrase [Anaerovoracaceae bacterium]